MSAKLNNKKTTVKIALQPQLATMNRVSHTRGFDRILQTKFVNSLKKDHWIVIKGKYVQPLRAFRCYCLALDDKDCLVEFCFDTPVDQYNNLISAAVVLADI